MKPCRCPAALAARYRGRVSGPLLDRFDLRIDVRPVDAAALLSESEPATVVDRDGLDRAREAQAERATRLGLRRSFNARIPPGIVHAVTRPTKAALAELTSAARRMALSGRGVHRTLRVARTIADLAGLEQVDERHVREALAYRGENA